MDLYSRNTSEYARLLAIVCTCKLNESSPVPIPRPRSLSHLMNSSKLHETDLVISGMAPSLFISQIEARLRPA